jgi:5-(carboxyamino)imidazole ribonucleotide synthase
VNQKAEKLPGGTSRVGVLGGGQLGRMMAIAGIPLGLNFVFLDPSAEACAGALGDLLQSGFSDADAARRMASMVDVATFDFENVPQETASAVEELKPLYPPSGALGSCQDRLVEKEILARLGIRVAPYHTVSSRTDLLDGLDRLSFPAILKTRRLGYDGKGQVLIRDQEDLERAWQALGDSDLILEAFVPFEAECSLIAVRGIDGETRFWPLTRNLHSSGILSLSLAGDFDQSLQDRAQSIISSVLDHFDYVGVLTLEFFVLDGELLVNEIAPRVHNSGHWTIDGAETSQFENHLRAITAMPLGGTSANREALMFNWIGHMPDREQILSIPGVHWHDYGKSARPGRKIGHATLTADCRQELALNAQRLATAAGGEFPGLLKKIPGLGS